MGGVDRAGLPPEVHAEPRLVSAGKSTHIWAHDLPGLFEQRRLQQQVPLSIPTNRLTQRIVPRLVRRVGGRLGKGSRQGSALG